MYGRAGAHVHFISLWALSSSPVGARLDRPIFRHSGGRAAEGPDQVLIWLREKSTGKGRFFVPSSSLLGRSLPLRLGLSQLGFSWSSDWPVKCDIKVETSQRLIPSRDRKGADGSMASKFFRNEQRHGFALLLDYVLKCPPYVLVLP